VAEQTWKEKLLDLRIHYEMKRLEFLERKMDMYAQSTRRKSYIRIVFASILAVIVIGCMFFLFTRDIPSGNRDVVIALVSALTGAFFGSVINYYFGDSDKSLEPMPTFEEKHDLSKWDNQEEEIDES